MSAERHIIDSLEEAGFSEAQVEALIAAFTVNHHSHTIDEVLGLQEELEEIGGEEEDDSESDDEE